MKSPEQWLEQWGKDGKPSYRAYMLNFVQAIQKDAADSRSSQLWDELEHPIKWKDKPNP